MNKRLLLFIIGVIIVIGGLYELTYTLSFKKITVTIDKPGVSVIIQDAKSNKILKTLNSSGAVSLREGNYNAVPNGSTINTTPIAFSVGKSTTTVDINPDFSSIYLATVLQTQLPAIQSVIDTAYAKNLPAFMLRTGQLYQDGTWYATTLVEIPAHPSDNGDVYRLIMHQSNGKWAVVATPQIVISALANPSIPVAVIDAANDQTGY